MQCQICYDSGWKPVGVWRPFINDAIPCECGALARKFDMTKELVDVKVSDYLVEGFENTKHNLDRIYSHIFKQGKMPRLVLTEDALQLGSDPRKMHSYNTGSLSAIWRAAEVMAIVAGETVLCKSRPV